jgi:hypothetical protein
MIHCKNCERPFKGNFCPNCGQAATIKKIDLYHFIHDIPHSVFHIDKGFWYTLRTLFTSPGFALAEYLNGKRIRHFRPFAYLVIMSAVYVFLSPLIEDLAEHVAGRHIYTNEKGFFAKYISVLLFLIVPFLSLVTWLVFRKGYNYWEHFLVNTYLAAQTNVVLLGIKLVGLAKVFFGLSANVNFTIAMFIFMFYYSFTFVDLMKPFYKRKTITLRLLLMNFFLATIYMTAFSLGGIMTAWWGGK